MHYGAPENITIPFIEKKKIQTAHISKLHYLFVSKGIE
jgi:hypothetical protein